MKKKAKQTLRDKTGAELRKLVVKEKGAYQETQLVLSEQKDKNVLKKKRHAIARMLTFLHEKELEGLK